MSIDLTAQEIEEIRGLVRIRMGELNNEIHHTILSEYRDKLKLRRAFLADLLAKLERAERGSEHGFA